MNTIKKIKSIFDLGRFAISDVVYRIVLRPLVDELQIPSDYDWMRRVHPKIFFDSKLTKGWVYQQSLPKLGALDFIYVTDLLTSKVCVEKLTIQNIVRSTDTGEFYYHGADGEWLPESCLLSTETEAITEKTKLKNLFIEWINDI